MEHLKKKSSSSNDNGYIKYIGLSFQLCGIIGLGTWIGWLIQKKSEQDFPVWLLLFCFLSIAIAFYQLFQSLKNENKIEDKRKKP
ncbi:AtpZ/AtpI family protein [Belliella kenyensis]|uniref:AtpZ/AtpI family protein n=1 Tax=Belliella kenyensis TaxID=1472724 RepID=A0ABV8EPH9_9BACT|nr:AtpZ/AtpI family protein [Belliella kenyensis]MDN3603342.1 AtpZ/AtpI family protein [Belliella kenyensis]